ncbi:MAG: glycosyltransferase [Phycisphaeraceae bacterium]|nr:MAG: glycosyltransferase [Phycisphaeraceae bacterium]
MGVSISIVTPSYNQGRFLEQTIRSVLAQRDQAHEYFVLDGGSNDGSHEIIERYTDRLDWWVSEPDKGQCHAINRGFARATGDVLYWVNSDDLLLPGTLAAVRDAFDRDPGLGVVTGYTVVVDAENQIIDLRRRMPDSPRMARLGYLRSKQPSVFFRRSLFEAVGGLDESLECVLDTDLWLKMMRAGARWGGLPRYLSAERRHGEMKGVVLTERYGRERALLRERYPEFAAGPLKRQLGRVLYYADQITTGRSLAWRRDQRRMLGRDLAGVFSERCCSGGAGKEP